MSAWLIVLVTLIYLGVCVDLARRGDWPMSLVYAGYAIANVGMIWALK